MEFVQSRIQFAALAVLTIAFNFLFWMENPGVNYVLYSLLFVGLMLFLHKDKWKQRRVLLSVLCIAVSLFSLVWIGSLLSIIMYFASVIVFTSFFYTEELYSLYYIIPESVFSFFYSLVKFFEKAGKASQKTTSGKKINRMLKLAMVPVIITLVFFFLYFGSNIYVEKFTVRALDILWEYFSNFFKYYPFHRFLFIFFGATLACYFVFHKKANVFSKLEIQQSNAIERTRRRSSFNFTLNALKIEYKIAFLTLISLNFILLMVNVVDVWKVWISFDYAAGSSLSAELHKGIYLLILSIVLSIALLIYFFRGNINFMKDNRFLKYLAFSWMAQNIVLALTAFLKCLYYINYYDLTYKRIGVLMFLCLTVFGLIMMFLKIEKRKSVFFLLRNNTWFIYFFFMAMTLINWDVAIAKYNLSAGRKNTDYTYLYSLSDKVIPVLMEHDNSLADPANGNTPFSKRIRRYVNMQDQVSFLSWTAADDSLEKYLRAKGFLSADEEKRILLKNREFMHKPKN
ncbi:MAG: DUF4173 domain-containing protein [Bacteroidetes bacterium]|nr:DUF4173 domain-containing protein [Bacteroidota bacterium]